MHGEMRCRVGDCKTNFWYLLHRSPHVFNPRVEMRTAVLMSLIQGWRCLPIARFVDLLTDGMVFFCLSLNSGRTVQYKHNAQFLRLFGLHGDVNDAHRAGANRFQNKQTTTTNNNNTHNHHQQQSQSPSTTITITNNNNLNHHQQQQSQSPTTTITITNNNNSHNNQQQQSQSPTTTITMTITNSNNHFGSSSWLMLTRIYCGLGYLTFDIWCK